MGGLTLSVNVCPDMIMGCRLINANRCKSVQQADHIDAHSNDTLNPWNLTPRTMDVGLCANKSRSAGVLG
eukprot:175285-Pelagomonas_calceolata.AAC.3